MLDVEVVLIYRDVLFDGNFEITRTTLAEIAI